MIDLRIYLFGAPTVTRGDEPVETGRRKATALFSYLVLANQMQRRETLANIFWPELSASAGRADLSRILSVLRKQLGKGWLRSNRQTIGLEPGVNIWVDVLEFRRSLARVRSHAHPNERECQDCLRNLSGAIDLYKGDFMAGFTLADSPEFDDWQALRTDSLRQELAAALEHLARLRALNGDFQKAIQMAQRRLNLDPLHEPAQRQLMRIYFWSGDRSAAIRQYQACRQILDVELGVPPEKATHELYEAIRAGQGPSPLSISDSDERPISIPHNIPPQPTPFVGRQQEMAHISTLIRDEPACRLLTLVGPGGIGKTRLAIQTALQMVTGGVDFFPHGVFFVSLVGVNSQDALIPTIVERLNLSFYSGSTPQEQLLSYLSQKSILIVLDNLEHLLLSSNSLPQEKLSETLELLTTITKLAPQVKLLVTSRERLNLQEEWVFEVSGLSFPTSIELEETTVTTHSAVELFLQRARRARSTFILTEADHAAVTRICQLVAGSPLGIELAAAWVRMMSCQDIALEIERGLDFLTTSLQNIPERHRSLRNIFEQSWSHLSEDEAAVFKRLSVFQDGFRPRAAERVAGATLRVLSALMDKSLLRRTRAGRYEIQELLRQFAREKLAADSRENRHVRDRYAEYFAVFLQQRQDDLGQRQQEALAEILAEIDNVRTAWEWSVRQKNEAAVGKSLEALFLTYWLQGWFDEGESLFDRAVICLSGVENLADLRELNLNEKKNAVLGKLLTSQGFFRVRLGRYQHALESAQQGVALLRNTSTEFRGDLAYGLLWSSVVDEVNERYSEANRTIEEMLDLHRQTGNRWGIGTALVRLGQVARRQGMFEEAEIHLRDGVAVLKESGDHKGVAYALDDLGHVMRAQGNYRQAQQQFEETLESRQRFADQEGIVLSLKNVGDMHSVLGRLDQAHHCYMECLRLAREIGYTLKIADSLDGLGMVARLQGEFERAEQRHQESLKLYKEIGMLRRVVLCLTNLGRLAIDKGDYARAEDYLQESLAHCQHYGYDRESILCLCFLGYLSLDRQRAEAANKAADYFHRALKLAVQFRSVPAALDILVGLAILLVQSAEKRRAAELLTLALDHRASHADTKDAAAGVLTEIESQLTQAEFKASIQKGKSLDLEQTAARLIASLEPEPPSGGEQPLAEPLTARELEVLGLVATGQSNREIAQELFIALGTVKTHVHNICGKLNVPNRVKAAAKAKELGLL